MNKLSPIVLTTHTEIFKTVEYHSRANYSLAMKRPDNIEAKLIKKGYVLVDVDEEPKSFKIIYAKREEIKHANKSNSKRRRTSKRRVPTHQ